MTAGVSNRRDQDALAANEIGHVKWKSRKVDTPEPARTLPPKKRLPDGGRTDAHELRSKASTQARHTLLVISHCLLGLRDRLGQELQHHAH
jgi:hypothetical protein